MSQAVTSLRQRRVSCVIQHACNPCCAKPSLCRRGRAGDPKPHAASRLGRPRLWCPVPRLGSSVFSPASLGSWLRGLGNAPAVLVASAGSGAMPAREWDYLRGDDCFKVIPLTPVLSVTGGQGLASLGL